MTVPRSILARGKQGFDVSLDRWFGEDFGRLAREVVFDPRAGARGFGLDTPQSADPRKPVQCFAQEASAQATTAAHDLRPQLVFC